MRDGLVRGWCLRAQCLQGGARGAQFQCRLFRLVQALFFWALLSLFGRHFQVLTRLPGGLARFLPCQIGAHHCPLRYLGWEKCGHGLTSRPRETSDPAFLDSLLEVFSYPVGSGRMRLAGELPLRFYSCHFALRKPTWGLPENGGLQGILTLEVRMLVWSVF